MKENLKRKKLESCALMTLLAVSVLFSLASAVGAETAEPKPEPEFSWREMTFDYSLNRVWNDDSSVINHSGTCLDVFSTNYHRYNESEQTMTKESRTTHLYTNYSYYSKRTIKGYVNIDMSLDMYRVDVQYGDAVDFIWMALKQGTSNIESFVEWYEFDYSLNEEYFRVVDSEFVKYDVNTSEVIDTWTETYNETGVQNVSLDDEPSNVESLYLYDKEFSMPLILIMQVYTTVNKDKIAWAEMFCDYIVYKDIDNDTIYSAGETSNPSASGFNLYSGDERVGSVRPKALNQHVYQEFGDRHHPEVKYNFSIHSIHPFDKTVSEIASTIQFTPPSTNENNCISWDIKYPQFPIEAYIHDQDRPFEESYYTSHNDTYASMSPGDFNYAFNYNLSGNQANLDFTLGLPKITNTSLYNAVQGYGLSIPHYNFFMTSFDFNEVDPIELTLPSDLFTFESRGTTVAEINMMNPIKKNYTLYDYPELGVNTEMESAGGSLHKLLIANDELFANYNYPIMNLIYSIKDIITFTAVDDLYHIETQNYPVWNGEKLIHDPTLSIYHKTPEFRQEPPEIVGFELWLIIGALVVVPSVVIKINFKKKRFRLRADS